MRELTLPQILRQVSVHFALTAVTCLSRQIRRDEYSENRTASKTSIVSFPSLSFSAVLGRQSRLLLLPAQSHSIFSMLSLRRLADIQCLIAVTQCSRAAIGCVKMQDMKMQDMKMKDQVASHENAGRENAGMKMHDMKMQDRCNTTQHTGSSRGN